MARSPLGLTGLGLGAFGLVAASSLVVPSEAQASLSAEVTLKHLVTVADAAVEATPEEATSVWEDTQTGGRRIVTYTRLTVHDRAYGDAQGQVWVRTLGGQVGEIGQRVEGEAVLVPGERMVLFLKAMTDGTHRVAEMAQGQYLVKHDAGALRLKPSPFVGLLLKAKDEKVARLAARNLLANKAIGDAMSLIKLERKGVAK